MALNLGGGRRRWSLSCRAARRGGGGGSGCRHFHVHYHLPRQVRAFPSVRRLPFSWLSYLLVLPSLFFAFVAFLVFFGWFTLVYFVSSLLGQRSSHERSDSESDGDARDPCRDEVRARNREERAGDSVEEGIGGGSAMAEDASEGQQLIKEVFVDGFSDASTLSMPRLGSPYACTKDDHEEHSSCEKLVEEVTVVETNCKEFNGVSYSDVSSEKEQLQDTSVDWFVAEIASREFCASCGGSTNLLHLQSGQEFSANNTEAPACCATSETIEVIDKHETGTVAAVCSDDNLEENCVKWKAEFPDDIFANRVPEDIFDEHHQDTQVMVTGRTSNNKPSQDHRFIEEKGMEVTGTSDETHGLNNENEMSGLPDVPVREKEYSTVATSNASSDHIACGEDDTHVQELIAEDNRAEASCTTNSVCENNQANRGEVGGPSTEDNVHEAASGESSVVGRTEDADENSFTSEGGLRRLPLARRSQPPWWNLCGVLEVFSGCKD